MRPVRCSLCGQQAPGAGCPRCDIRALAARGLAPPDSPEVQALHAALERVERAQRARWNELVATRGHVKVALVGCGRAKRIGRHRARALYTGSLFRAALSHAERCADAVFVLSAKHGLVELDQVLGFYDARLPCRDEDRRLWGRHVERSLRLRFVGIPLAITILAGAAYADAFGAVAQHNRWQIEQPLRGMGIGQRLAWFSERKRTASTQLGLRL